MTFPVNPVAGQTYRTPNNISYIFVNGAWVLQSVGAALVGGDSANISIDTTSFNAVGNVAQFNLGQTEIYGSGITVNTTSIILQPGRWRLTANLRIGFATATDVLGMSWRQNGVELPRSRALYFATAGNFNETYQPCVDHIADISVATTFTLAVYTFGAAGATLQNSSQGSQVKIERLNSILLGSPRPPKITRFLTSGTWIPDPLAAYFIIEGQGAGGAGNSASSNATTTSVSAGGGAGGYFKTLVTAAQLGTGSRTITIGQGAIGSAGGNTTVQGVGTANGGDISDRTEIPQGGQNAIFRALPYFARGGAPGGASVILGQVIVAKRGGVGARGFIQNNTGQGGDFIAYMRGFGGQSEFGSSLDQSYSNASNGNTISVPGDAVASDQYGAGGNGAFTVGNTGANGSAGVSGIVIITEYYQ